MSGLLGHQLYSIVQQSLCPTLTIEMMFERYGEELWPPKNKPQKMRVYDIARVTEKTHGTQFAPVV